MKRIFFLLLFVVSLQCFCQQQFFMIDNTSGTPPPAGSTVRIEGEAFDTWGNTQAYVNNDADASLYTMAIAATSYCTYGINTAAGGSHQVTFRVLSPNGAGELVVKDNGGTTLATVSIPFNTGWADVTTSITLASGSQTIRIERGTGNDLNLNYFDIDNSLQSPTIRLAYISFSDEYGAVPDYNSWPNVTHWNNLTTAASVIQTGGAGYTTTTLRTDHLVKWGWGLATTNAWLGTSGGPQSGSNSGVFGSDGVLAKQWQGNDGSAFKITGLNSAKTYDFWFLCSSESYDPQTVSFTLGATTSSTHTTASNIGDNVTYPNWQDDPALIHVSGITPTAGEIAIVCNLVSGNKVPLTVMVVKENQ